MVGVGADSTGTNTEWSALWVAMYAATLEAIVHLLGLLSRTAF